MVETESGLTMLKNFVNNYEQCEDHKIVPSCFQRPMISGRILHVAFISYTGESSPELVATVLYSLCMHL